MATSKATPTFQVLYAITKTMARPSHLFMLWAVTYLHPLAGSESE
jgi:hypothetical protein